MTVIAADRLIATTAGRPRLLHPGFVRVVGATIIEVAAGRPPHPPDVELRGGMLIPGLVDLQVNGCFGVDLLDVDPAGWARVVRRLPETGCTAFLPTFVTAPVPRLVAALDRAAALLADLPPGARVLGAHVEGPFLSPRRKGAHRQAWLADPTPQALAALIAAGGGLMRLHTLAPERKGAREAIRELTAAGVLVSIGHSDATAAEVSAAADAGARMVTHLFNAQRPMRHRDPGVPGVALTDPRLTSGLIADLHHVDPLVCRVALTAAPGRICLVTDAAASAGMPPGRYELGGEPVTQPPDGPPLREDGTIAGSTLRMDRAVANLVGLGVDLLTAVDAASRLPADLIGRGDLGRLAPGAAADLVWLDDDLRARATWVAGRLVHGTEGEHP